MYRIAKGGNTVSSAKFEILDKSCSYIDTSSEDSVDRPYKIKLFTTPKGPEECQWQNNQRLKKAISKQHEEYSF